MVAVEVRLGGSFTAPRDGKRLALLDDGDVEGPELPAGVTVQSGSLLWYWTSLQVTGPEPMKVVASSGPLSTTSAVAEALPENGPELYVELICIVTS